MHTIQNIEEFVTKIESTVHEYFGNGRSAEEGKEAIKTVIAEYAELVKAPKAKETKEIKIEEAINEVQSAVEKGK